MLASPRRLRVLALVLVCALPACSAESDPPTASAAPQPQTQTQTQTQTAAAGCLDAPRISARRVGEVIRVAWSVGDGATCPPGVLVLTAHSETSANPPTPAEGGDIETSAGSGVATIRPVVDHPPYVVRASVISAAGRSEIVKVSVAGERRTAPRGTPGGCDLGRRGTCVVRADAPRPRFRSGSEVMDALYAVLEHGSWRLVSGGCAPEGICDVLLARKAPAGEARVTVRFGGSPECPVVSSWSVETPSRALSGMRLLRSTDCW